MSLSCRGLSTEKEEGALSQGRARAELLPAVLRAPARGWPGLLGITPAEKLSVPPPGAQTTSWPLLCCVVLPDDLSVSPVDCQLIGGREHVTPLIAQALALFSALRVPSVSHSGAGPSEMTPL